MPRIAVPADRDPLVYVWTELAPPLTAAAGAYSSAVYERSNLSLREFEAATDHHRADQPVRDLYELANCARRAEQGERPR